VSVTAIFNLSEARSWGAGGGVDTMTLPTWTGKSHFKYEGSVGKGTHIWFGKNERPVPVEASRYAKLLGTLRAKKFPVGTSRDKRSLEVWENGYR